MKKITRSSQILFITSVLCFETMASGLAQNVRVVWSEHPQTEAVVVWDSETSTNSYKLLVDTVSRGGVERDYTFHIPVTDSGLYTESAETPTLDYFYHHAKLENLKPGTIYHLAIKTDEEVGREYRFRTAPEEGQPFKLISVGDSRTRLDATRSISTQIGEMVGQDESLIALVHGGDYTVTTHRNLWKTWLEAYALTTSESGRLLPIIPVIGNHDVVGGSPIFRQAYGYPGGMNDYYTCRLSPSVAILCLNTEISTEGDQKNFLREELATLEDEQTKWRIAVYHQPAYPAIKGPSAAKASWVPLFEEFNLDLVLESDGHCIKRTVPIRAEQEAADGIVYLGEGGYGAPQRDPKTNRWYIAGENAFASRGDHFMVLEVTSDAIHYSTVLNSGEVVDSATFAPKR